jgi:para-aminobenzoate synthetase/4-amino-4-deoxychorismate lyase
VQDGSARCGIGSGITADATAQGEWQEWRHKRSFLERASAPFELLETLALEDGVLRHLPQHLARLAHAATHFGYSLDAARVDASLMAVVKAHPSGLWRVRLRLDARGRVSTEAFALEASPERVSLSLAGKAFE